MCTVLKQMIVFEMFLNVILFFIKNLVLALKVNNQVPRIKLY